MTGPDSPPDLGPRLLTMRIIHGALCLGVLIFLGIALYHRLQGGMHSSPPLLTYLAAGWAVVTLGVVGIVSGVIDKSWRRQMAQGKWPRETPPPSDPYIRWVLLYQTRLIIRMGFLEGAAFLAVIAYLIEGQALSLGLAGGLLLVMFILFPTRVGIDSWVETQRSRMEGGG